MKRLLTAGILMLWALAGICDAPNASATPTGEPHVPKPEVAFPFPVGEKLTYSIYWGWIGVGKSVATTRWKWVEDEWRLLIRFRTRSNSILSSLYPVDDVVETEIDPETLRPLVFRMNLKEGDHRRNEVTVFDWDAMEARYLKRHEDKEDETKTYPIKADTRDLVSFMYFMRSTPFRPESEYDFEVMSDEKLYDLKVKSGGYEKIKLDRYDRVKSLRLDPRAKFQGIFVRKGEMRVWVSDDERRIMTKMLLDTPFANVRLLLLSVEGPGEDAWVTGGKGDAEE